LIFGGKSIALLLLAALLVVLLCNYWIEVSTQKQVFTKAQQLPNNDVGLVLGTSRYTKRGFENPYFANRIKAAVQLFKLGKIKHLIVSGDNSLKEYNEPRYMLKALIKEGIPEQAITMDFAGFRTLDSIVRCRKVFGQKKVTVISQKFHNHRALFIANHHQVEAVAFNAQGVPLSMSKKVRAREYLARCKAILDILLNKQPKFLGEQVPLKIND